MRSIVGCSPTKTNLDSKVCWPFHNAKRHLNINFVCKMTDVQYRESIVKKSRVDELVAHKIKHLA